MMDTKIKGPTPFRPLFLDKLITLNAFNCECDRKCKTVLRVVKVWIEEKQEEMMLITNNLKLAATTIAAIYKERWQIELFFKALKQNLRVKTFVGTSANAVRIQIWTALISMLLVKYLQFKSKCKWHLSNRVALLRLNLLPIGIYGSGSMIRIIRLRCSRSRFNSHCPAFILDSSKL
jgi:hypothetical protein